LDAEHDTMDGSSDKILSTTTYRKAGMGQKEGRHSPLKGELTHLVGEGIYAKDLVPNPRASGLIALHDLLLLYLVLQILFGEDRKIMSGNCFSILPILILHRFDLVVHASPMKLFPYSMSLLLYGNNNNKDMLYGNNNNIYIYIYILG
jgi:hypothetical protein